MASTPTLYKIRLLDTESDLMASFRLRYEVYRALGYLRSTLASELEIDEHDACALPFGAFDLSTGDLIGTIRLLSSDPHPGYERMIRRVVEACGDARLAERVFGERGDLPSILSPRIAREIAVCNTSGFPVRELSRSITHPDHRGSGVGRGLMELGLTYAMQDGPVFLVGGCQTEHLPMYARYGYDKLPHTELDHFAAVDQVANVVVCRTDRLPDPTYSHTRALLRSLLDGDPGHTRPLGCGSQALFTYPSAPEPPAPHALAI